MKKDSYSATVNYSLSFSLMERVRQGNYNNHGDIIGHALSQFPRSEKGEVVQEVCFELVPFHTSLQELKEKSLRRAGVEELLAFGAKYKIPELIIVACGSCYDTPIDVVDHVVIGGRRIPCIMQNTVVTIYSDVYGDGKYRQLAVYE